MAISTPAEIALKTSIKQYIKLTTYTLQELNEYIRQVVALNFTDPIWISCEISQINESRGNVYLDLIQNNESTNEVLAQMSAAIWYKQYLFIRKKLGELRSSILTNGTKVLLKVQVDFHERYGMKLIVEDIDPSYTIGQMEMARQKIIERLKKENLLDLNENTRLPNVIQKIAIISSSTAAGYKDLTHQLDHNEYGYDVHYDLFQAAMQGTNTEKEVINALDEIRLKTSEYDCVVLSRGGGSKLDLSAFDNYKIACTIATFPIPVLTGIGHEIDTSIADMVSHSNLKTPTAVAQFIIDRNLQFESDIIQAGLWIKQLANQKIAEHKLLLNSHEQQLRILPMDRIRNAKRELQQTKILLTQASKYALKELKENVNYMEQMIKIASPERVLKRGFSIIKAQNKVVGSVKGLNTNDAITIHTFDGSADAQIIDVKRN